MKTSSVMKWSSIVLVIAIYSLTKGDIDNAYAEIIPAMLLFKRKIMPIGCVNSCRGIPNGNYHSCRGCRYFSTCSNGYLIGERKCEWFGGLVWNDDTKRCEWYSSTCRHVVYPFSNYGLDGICVKNCFGMINGDYQSCHGCREYVTCSNGLSYDHRPCPWFLVWDDKIKRCQWRSRTCRETKR